MKTPCLVSEQAANLLPAFDWEMKPDKLVVVVSSKMTAHASLLEPVLRDNGIRVERLGWARQAYKAGLDENLFQRNRTKINQALRKALGLAAAPYCIEVRGSRPHCRYGLALPPERITFAPPA